MVEHLTIRQIKKELRDLYDELDLYLKKKKINYYKTQPKGTDYNKIMVSSSHSSFDRFAHYVIKDEELDIKIVSLLESINAYEEIIIKRIKSIALANEGYAKVITLREDEKYAREHKGKPRPWNLIGEAAGYDEKQCRRIWQDYLNS